MSESEAQTFLEDPLWGRFIRDLKNFYASSYCSVRTLLTEKPANVNEVWEPMVLREVEFTSDSVLKTQMVTEDYSMVLRELHDAPKLVVVSGPSGSGKSTLARKLVMDWTSDLMPNVSLLMAIPSSFLVSRIKNGFELGEIFVDYMELCGHINNQSTLRHLCQLHIKWFGSSILLVADHNVLSKNNDVLPCRLWSEPPCHTVLMTNRSAPFLSHLSRKAAMVVEIFGYSRERSLAIGEKLGGVKLGHLMTDHPYLWAMCESPLMSLMIAEVFLDNKTALTSAESDFDIVQHYVRQNLAPYAQLLGVDSIKPHGDLRRLRFVQSLGRYAFEILTYSWKYEMQVELSEAQIWALFLAGILVCRGTGKLNFDHDCVAEFFASLYVSSLLQLRGSRLAQLTGKVSGKEVSEDHWKKVELLTNPSTFALFSRDHKYFLSFLRSASPKWYDHWFSRRS